MTSSSGRLDYHYIHAGGRAVAQFTTSDFEADELQYLLRDHQGSVVATTSTSGTVLDRFEYDPFGVRTTTVGDDDRSHRGYTGHEHLAALDLVHMNGRVQDPLLGRFLSPDPFVQAPYHSQSLNRYSYVWNNPMTLVDPSGFQGEDLPPGTCPANEACLYPACINLSATPGNGWLCNGPNAPPGVTVGPTEDPTGSGFVPREDPNGVGSGVGNSWDDNGVPLLPGEPGYRPGVEVQRTWIERVDPLFCHCDYDLDLNNFMNSLGALPGGRAVSGGATSMMALGGFLGRTTRATGAFLEGARGGGEGLGRLTGAAASSAHARENGSER